MSPTQPHPDASNLPYRPCVGIMLINQERHVFVGRRITDKLTHKWQMPQGGIDPGESPAQAALRELEEEAGTAKARILAESKDWFSYDLPPELLGLALKGKFKGQKQKWFAMAFEGRDEDINIATAEAEFDAWRWAKAEELVDLIVPFKRSVYRQVVAEFASLTA